MAADGDAEIEATLARLTPLCGGRVFEGSMPDETALIRDASGKIRPHILIDFGAPVRTVRDRNLTNGEKGQPHIIPAQVACIGGTAAEARKVAKAVINKLLDWAPSATSDSFELKGGFGTRNNATGNIPTRYNRQLYFEVVINQGIDAD